MELYLSTIKYWTSHLFISTTLYSLWLEFHPKMGNVIFRKDAYGNTRFMFFTIFKFIKLSITEIYMWTQLPDLNYLIFLFIYYKTISYLQY